MSAMTDWLEAELRKHLFRTGSMTKPAAIVIRLYTAAPGETGGGTEVSGAGYAAPNLNPLDANWTAASATDGVTDNASQINFGVPTANWGVITHFRIDMDANAAIYGALAQAKTVNNGDAQPNFPVGSLDVTFA